MGTILPNVGFSGVVSLHDPAKACASFDASPESVMMRTTAYSGYCTWTPPTEETDRSRHA
jgi:hypothetical protein